MDATSAFFHHNDPEYPEDWCGDYLSVDLANQWYRKSVLHINSQHTLDNK